MNKEYFDEFPLFFKGKKILITGITGFKGSWLSYTLLKFGAKVVGYSLEPNTNPNMFSSLELHKKMKTYFSDIRDYKKLKKVIDEENPGIIFHLAAQPLVRTSYDDPLTTFSTNILGTANVLEATKENKKVKAVVLITTDKVYENKEWIWPYRENDELGGYDPYSSSKACAELVIKSYTRSFFNPDFFGKNHNTIVVSARAGNVIGGGDWSKDRLIPDMIKSMMEKKEVLEIRNPSAIRPWQHVLEPLFGYMLLAKKAFDKDKSIIGPWNFASEEDSFIKVKDVVEKGVKILGKGKYVFGKEDETKHETRILKLDSTKAKSLLNWKSRLSVDESIKMTFEWYKCFYEDRKNIINFTNKQIEYYTK
mgnify:CR=1 FL=1